MNTTETGMRWTSSSKYVDIDTGEIINKKQALSNKYIKLKTIKNARYNDNKTQGHLEYTIRVKRTPQTELGFD